MFLLLWLTKIADFGLIYIEKSKRFLTDLYQITFSENKWIISSSGQFIDSKYFAIEDTYKDYWVYSDNTLTHLKVTEGRPKRMPYLSCIFKADGISVAMDDFLDNTRCNNIDELTLPILMAAFSVREKKLFNWYTADYEAINRDGDKLTFKGKSVGLPVVAEAVVIET